MLYIDTDIAVGMIHGTLNIDEMQEKIGKDEKIAITAPSMMELYHGLYTMQYRKKGKVSNEKIQKEKASIELIKRTIIQIPFNVDAADSSSRLFHELAGKGQEIDINDCMIAATIVSRGDGALLTRNIDHFKHIPGLKLIQLS